MRREKYSISLTKHAAPIRISANAARLKCAVRMLDMLGDKDSATQLFQKIAEEIKGREQFASRDRLLKRKRTWV